MRRLSALIINAGIALASGLCACHPIEDYGSGNRADFEALWSAIDEHYCFFEEKDVDWQEVYNRYSPAVDESLSRRQLFELCSKMINELRDGHTNLSAGFETSYYRKWWSDYPQNYVERLVEESYFGFNYRQIGSVSYGILPQNVGYIHIPGFTSGLSSGNIDWILSYLGPTNGIVIDLRDNGGGNMSDAETWARHFITERRTVGYMRHKTGPGHGEFSSPYPIEFEPLEPGHIVWGKPVVVLTNRSTFSAANYLVMVMKELPQVIHAGATTGGGSGMPYSLELPGGWGLRMSAVQVLDSHGNITEGGIEPDEGCAVALDADAAMAGKDTMLDFAIKLIK